MREQGTKIEVNSKDDWKKYSKFVTGKYTRVAPLTIEEINFLVNTKYCDCGPHTKEYIRQELLKDDKKCILPTIIVKEDFIEDLERERPDLGVLQLDYSGIPNIIDNKNIMFTVWSKATIGGIEIGPVKVGYRNTIIKKKDFLFNKFKKHIGEEINPKIEDYYLEKIKKKQGDRYDYSDSHITSRHGLVRLKCKTCNGIIWVLVKDAISREIECFECNQRRMLENKRLQEEQKFIRRAKEVHPEVDLSKLSYTRFQDKCTFICPKCGKEYEQDCRGFLRGPGICPNCVYRLNGDRQRSNLEEFKEKLDKVYGPGTFDYSKAVYIDRTKPITLIDIETGLEFSSTPNNLLSGAGYSVRHKNSLGERLVQKCLVELGIKFESEVRKDGVFEGHYVRIDFILPDLNVWIEYNGKQHYQCCPEFLRLSEDLAKEKFKVQQERDEAIRVYCREQGITLIEIPYTLSTYEQIKKYINDSIQTKNIQ